MPTVGDFTVEAFVTINNINSGTIFYLNGAAGTGYAGLHLSYSAGNYILKMSGNGTTWLFNRSAAGVTRGTWSHVVVVRDAYRIKLLVNDCILIEEQLPTNTTLYAGTVSEIGRANYTADYGFFNGEISNLRIAQGLVYSANTKAPLTASSTDVRLLTCVGNAFKDYSTFNRAITAAGAPMVRAHSPFAVPESYTAPNVGSAYMNGKGDYLSLANNAKFLFGSGNFTVETWVYPTGTSWPAIAGVWSSTTPSKRAWAIFIDGTGKIVFMIDPNDTQILKSTTSVPIGAWTHIAITRSGNTYTLYINGEVHKTATLAHTMQAGSGALEIGTLGDHSTFGNQYYGFISGLRISKGTVRYTGAFTPAAITTNTNADVLLLFNNTAVYDASRSCDIETVGSTTISTARSKTGTTSMYFNGQTGCARVLSARHPLGPISGDFTIDMWINWAAIPPTRTRILLAIQSTQRKPQ